MCDHLYSPALTSQGSYATASGVSRKWEGGKTRCGRNRLITAQDVEPQGARELFLRVGVNVILLVEKLDYFGREAEEVKTVKS